MTFRTLARALERGLDVDQFAPRRWRLHSPSSGQAAAGDANLMEPLLDCARADVTEGEIVEAPQTIFGAYTETPVL